MKKKSILLLGLLVSVFFLSGWTLNEVRSGGKLPLADALYDDWSTFYMLLVDQRGQVRDAESTRHALEIAMVTQTSALALNFQNLSDEQVSKLKSRLPQARLFAAPAFAKEANALVQCIEDAKVGDNLRECALSAMSTLHR